MANFSMPSPMFGMLQGWVLDRENTTDILLSNDLSQRILAPIDSIEAPSILGRRGVDMPDVPPHFIHLTEKKSVSRQHALIYWDKERGVWKIKCTSKNGMVVNTRKLFLDDCVDLPDRSTMKVGPVVAYFVLPLEEIAGEGSQPAPPNPAVAAAPSKGSAGTSAPEVSAAGPAVSLGRRTLPGKYAGLIAEAFESAALSGDIPPGVGLSKKEIVGRCISNHPELAEPKKRKNLLASIGGELKKRATVDERTGQWTLPSEFLGGITARGQKPPEEKAASEDEAQGASAPSAD